MQNAPTAYGAITISVNSNFGAQKTIAVNLSLPMEWASTVSTNSDSASSEPLWTPPPGGIRLRLRSPDTGSHISQVTVGGKVSHSIDSGEETVIVPPDALTSSESLVELQSIVVTYRLIER